MSDEENKNVEIIRPPNQDDLEYIHMLLRKQMIDELEECQREKFPLDAANKAVIAKFLKDNSVVVRTKSSDMDRLKSAFIEVEQKRAEIQERLEQNARQLAEDDITDILI